MKSLQKASLLIVLVLSLYIPTTSFARTKPINTTDLLEYANKTEKSDNSPFKIAKTVLFSQANSGSTNASSISKITLAYFTSSDCTGNKAGTGFYTTPDGTSFAINIGRSFGMVASSAWNVGDTQLSIADMTTINSIAVTLKTTDNVTTPTSHPQSNFSGQSFACVPVTCSSGVCTSTSSTQTFTLKTSESIGDPADGGKIACLNGGINNLVVPTGDNSLGVEWGGSGTFIGATSTTDGAANTEAIVTALGAGGDYAAGICNGFTTAGGYTSGWFLPAGNNTDNDGQLYCLYMNQNEIGGFDPSSYYWSSTEYDPNFAWCQNFSGVFQDCVPKNNVNRIRCVRAFTP